MKCKPPTICWPVLLTACSLAGCVTNHYEMELKPTGESMQRELTCWRGTSADGEGELVPFPDEDLARIAAAYDAEIPKANAQKHTFAKMFTGVMPDDLGNSGTYTHWDSPLGSVSGYVERIRGNDDLLAMVHKRQQATDRLTDLLIGWLATRLEKEAEFAQLREFLDKQFRRDLINLSLYLWGYELATRREGPDQPDCLVRAAQYFAERSYFEPSQLPLLARAFWESEVQDPADLAHLLAFLQRFVASRMGIPDEQPIPKCLQFLADETAIESSIIDYLRQTEDYRQMLKEYEQQPGEKQPGANVDARKPEPSDVLDENLTLAFMPSFGIGRPDKMDVKLVTTTKPFLTNGQWEEKTKHVRWSQYVLEANAKLPDVPVLLYAFWGNPNVSVQQEHFGKIVLQEDHLGMYCLWYRGLSQQEAVEWDTFVKSLRPGTKLAERLRGFRFSHTPPARATEEDDQSSDIASFARDLILENLQ